MADWKVYYSGNFGAHKKGERPGREIPVEREFLWAGERWRIPAIYVCGAGLVVDFCVEADLEALRSYREKWCGADMDFSGRSDEEWAQMDAENPLHIHTRVSAVLNGRRLECRCSSSVAWDPGAELQEAEKAVRHYGCDPGRGWVFLRSVFPWATKRGPEIRTLEFMLEKMPVFVPGPHFMTGPEESGWRELVFVHPVSGRKHRLTIWQCEQKKLPREHFRRMPAAGPFGGVTEWPLCYTQMSYTLSPDLPEREFAVCDCESGDAPRQIQRDKGSCAQTEKNENDGVTVGVTVSVVSGGDGPTAFFAAGKRKEKKRTACSALCFEPKETVTWRIAFYVKEREDMTVAVLFTKREGADALHEE